MIIDKILRSVKCQFQAVSKKKFKKLFLLFKHCYLKKLLAIVINNKNKSKLDGMIFKMTHLKSQFTMHVYIFYVNIY